MTDKQHPGQLRTDKQHNGQLPTDKQPTGQLRGPSRDIAQCVTNPLGTILEVDGGQMQALVGGDVSDVVIRAQGEVVRAAGWGHVHSIAR